MSNIRTVTATNTIYIYRMKKRISPDKNGSSHTFSSTTKFGSSFSYLDGRKRPLRRVYVWWFVAFWNVSNQRNTKETWLQLSFVYLCVDVISFIQLLIYHSSNTNQESACFLFNAMYTCISSSSLSFLVVLFCWCYNV